MTSIDQVIARSRMSGGFSERKRFTVARRRGIEKLRKFALADPHYYVLELIQAAIANHAEYVDLRVDRENATLSYIGGGLTEHELGQLFDFLFASKDRSDIGHVRELALGLNAALLFKPDKIVVESGDATLAGSTRMVVMGDHDVVEVGRPEKPMGGTFISIQGMKRNKLGGKWFSGFNESWPREYETVEERCLAAPVPIVVGDTPLFGWSSQRTPALFGYKQVLAFDEGELYGTLGLKPSFGNPEFRLLTWGVAVQSRSHVLIDGQQIGGIICFDRLHKTVDHSGIVDDERLAELWERLKPYARQLVSGKKEASPYGATMLGQTEPLLPAQLRALVRGSKVVVAVPPGTNVATPEGKRAAAVGHALAAPVVCIEAEQTRILPVLAGGDLGIVRPDLDTEHDLALYRSAPAEPPPRPWLASPLDVPPLPTAKLASRLKATGQQTRDERERGHALADRLGTGDVQATVYTPAEGGDQHSGLAVEVLTTDRLLWRGVVPSAHSGHVLVISLPHTPPLVLREPIDDAPGAPAVVEEVARAVAEHASDTLATAFGRAVADLERSPDLAPGTRAASLGLAAAARSTVARLCRDGESPAFELVSLGTSPTPVLDLPLLASVDGTTHTLREVVARAKEGLLYGTIPEVPADLDGLDPSRVLQLSATDERTLVELVGDAAYVRVDGRDILAEHASVQVRDIAIGLRTYPDFPLLVEGVDPTAWPVEEQVAAVDTLLAQLMLRFLGMEPPRPTDPHEDPAWEEGRRQACRHLQWAAVTLGADAPDQLRELPLFLDGEGLAYSWTEVSAALQSGTLPLLYAQGLGDHELGQLAAHALEQDRPSNGLPRLLVASPFVHALLAPHGARPAFDSLRGLSADPTDPSATPMLAAVDIDKGNLRGHVGIPAEGVPPDVIVVLPDGKRTRAWEVARKYGMVGLVRISGTEWSHETYRNLVGQLEVAGHATLRKILERVRDTEPDGAQYLRMVTVLLQYAGRHLVLTARPDGGIESNVSSDLSTEVLGLPVFASRFGGPVPAWRLVRRFAAAMSALEREPIQMVLADLSSALPPALRSWIASHLSPANVARPPARPARPPTDKTPERSPLEHVEFARRIGELLEKLRPDDAEAVEVIVQYRGPKDAWITGGVQTIVLNADHWLLQWSMSHADDPNVLAWLLLAAYAYINEIREAVTNEHERRFQREVARALAAGEL